MTEEEVRQIRAEYKLVYGQGAPVKSNILELAQRYGVSQETIRRIAKGRGYKWVQ